MVAEVVVRPPAAPRETPEPAPVAPRRHADADEGWTFPWHASNGGC